MKKMLLMTTLLIATLSAAAVKVDKIDPPFWYAGMHNPTLQLMVYGQQIATATVSLDYPGVTIEKVVPADSKNYLFVYLNISKEAKPGVLDLRFKIGKKKKVMPYELKKRSMKGEERIGFDASDVLYMLMPDRFSNGNPANDQIEGLNTYKMDRSQPSLRHGGDLAGIENHLDYFTDLGVTALWFTPVLENNMADEGNQSSYHGYATTNYYKIDPRLGTNEEYKALIAEANKKGLKVIMDMIFNHCGSFHEWLKDVPMKDWFNSPNYSKQTSYKLTPAVDPYASKTDISEMEDGWFVKSMPDLNQKNPHVMRYLIQTSIWWIEYAGIDGIRMDTYPYANGKRMADWMKEINDEYPNYNVVGETWVTHPAYTATWQKDSKIAQVNSNLKTVMDFSFYEQANNAVREQTDGWWNGMNRVYNTFVYDYLYPNPLSVMAFLENHDTDRFLKSDKDSKKLKKDIIALKQALTLLLTTRRIPQLYYGTEILMAGNKSKTDGNVRKDFPGGWPNDTISAFTKEGRTAAQNDMFDYLQNLLQWRKGNQVISKGDMLHFMPYHGVYVYARRYEGKSVLVFLNGTDKAQTIPTARYQEILKGAKELTDILTHKRVNVGEKEIHLSARQSIVVER